MIFCGMFPFDVESFLGYLSEMPQHCSMSNLETSFVYVLFISKCELHHVLLSSSSLGADTRPLPHETIAFVAIAVTVDHPPPWPIASLTLLQSAEWSNFHIPWQRMVVIAPNSVLCTYAGWSKNHTTFPTNFDLFGSLPRRNFCSHERSKLNT